MDKTILLRLSDISTSYDGKTVFSGVTLDVHAHDFIGIVGPNGGGKTTLVKVMLGLKEVDNGMVERYRNGVVDPSVTIGYLPQYNHIDRMFPISVRDVVLTGLGAQKWLFAHFTSQHETQVDDALQRLDLMSLADRHIAALSGGQLQRVLLARAIVSKPDILILDEPNTYMDRHFQNDMYQLLHDLNNDCAIAIVSHDLDAVTKHAKRVLRVDHSVVEM